MNWSSIGRAAIAGAWLGTALAAMTADPAGTVKTLKGSANAERGGKQQPLAVGSAVYSGDLIHCGAASAAGLVLRDGTSLTCGPGATLDLARYAFDPVTHKGALEVGVKRGSLAVISGKLAKANPDAVRFNAGSVTLGVRGTEFVIETGADPAQGR